MAVYFDGTNDALVNTSWPVPDLTDGLTLACWFKVPAVATTRSLFGISRTGTSYESLYLQLESATLYAYTTTSSNYASALKGTVVANRWYHAAGTYASATSRVAWLNGVAGSVNTTSRATAGLDRLTLGKRYYNNSPTFGQANLAHVAVWRAILTATEMEWLYDGGRGIDPSLVRPDALICYYPLVDDYNCAAGPLHLTREDAPTWTNDSEQIILPRRRFFWRPEWAGAAAAGGVNATVAQSLPILTQAAAVDVIQAADIVQSLPILTQAATVDVIQAADIVQSLPILTQAATVAIAQEAVVSQTLPTLLQAATVDVEFAGTEAVVSQTLPTLGQTVLVGVRQEAVVAQSLAVLTQAAAVHLEALGLSATVSQVLPKFNQLSNVAILLTAAINQTLPHATSIDIVAFQQTRLVVKETTKRIRIFTSDPFYREV